MKRLLTLTLMLGTLFPGVYSEETGWNYKQTTLQSFYLFNVETTMIDGEGLQPEDVIGAFTDDGVCVGWFQIGDSSPYATVPTVGDDGADYSTNYLGNGDVPNFRVFDASSGDITTPTTQNGVLPLVTDNSLFVAGDVTGGGFANNALYIYGGDLNTDNVLGCSASDACNSDGDHWLTIGEFDGDAAFIESGGAITTDDGSCLVDDCLGECGGSAVIDDCGVCDGGNADNLGCGCFEPGPSGCDLTCGSTLENDCAGVCDGDAVIDECGECTGDDDYENFSCYGCTNPDSDAFDISSTIDDGSCTFSVSAPTGVTAEGGPARVVLNWDAQDADSFDIFADGVLAGSTSSNSAQILGLAPGVEYCMTVVANKSFSYAGEDFTLSSDPSEESCATPTESVGVTWGWQLTGNIDGWGMFEASSEHNYLGFSASATNGFDASLDIPEPPLGASQNYIGVYFSHPEWSYINGDNFTQDVRSESPEDLPACEGQDATNLECNLTEFEVLVVSDMAGEASLTFDEFSTLNALNGADVPVPANVYTYAEIDGVHHLVSDGTTLDFFLSEGTPKLITITIGNIVPQAPSNLNAEGGHLQIDLDWDSDTDDIQDIAGRYPATSFNVYRDGGPLSEDQTLSAQLSDHQENTDYNDQEDMEGNVGYGLLWESQYDYTVTGNNEAGESTDGHRVSHHDGSHTDIGGRQSDTGATTDQNTDPVSVTLHVETLNGTNVLDENGEVIPGHYEITHNGSADANTVNIHVDGLSSYDVDVNLAGDVETDQFGTDSGRYLWTQDSDDEEAVVLRNATTADVNFDIANVHDGQTKSVTLNLHVETDYPTKFGDEADMANGVADGIGTHENDQIITMLIDDEPNFDPVAPTAFAMRLAGNGLSVLTYDHYLDDGEDGHNDDNDYDAEDQIWYVPHDANPDTHDAALHFDASSTDEDAGDLDSTPGVESRDVLTYQYSLITGAAAGFQFEDLDGNGSYDIGEPIFYGGELGDEIYFETNYGDVIADGPTPADLDGSEDFATISDEGSGDGNEILELRLPSDVYILSMTVTDPYGDSDDVSYVIGVSSERNETPTSDAGLDQEWYMNYEEDYKDIDMSAHEVGDTDHDPLLYSWSYSYVGDITEIPSTTADAQTSNTGDHFNDLSNFHWNEINVYDLLPNPQGLVEGEHTFTLTATDPYGATISDSFVISVYNEPPAEPVVDLRVTNPDQAFKHIEVAWTEGVWADDAFVVDGVNIWTGDHANADYFIVYLNGEERATYINDESQVGETYSHLEPQLDAETDYTFVVESYNSDDRLGDESTDDVDQKTHDRPTVNVINPNGAEIASVGDLYNVDIETTNKQFIYDIDVFFLDEETGLYVEEEQVPALGTTGEHTQIRSDGVEIYYGAKVMVVVEDIGNYNDVVEDPDHDTGVLDESSVNAAPDSDESGNRQKRDDESDNSFTLAAHRLTNSYWGGWHLFGPALVPYESNMEVNLSECFGNFGGSWVAYDQAGNFDIATLELNLGQGYYLALVDSDDMFLDGNPVIGDPDDGHLSTLSLSKGWNLAANPLVNIIARDELTVEFDGETLPWQQAANAGWVQTNINTWYIDSHMHAEDLVPFGGYWIHTSRDLDVHVTPHLNDYSSREVAEDEGWTLKLNASDPLGVAGGDFVSISIKDNANDSFVYGEDEVDHPNTVQSEFIDMHIDRFDWVGVSDNNGVKVESPYFASDVRSFSGLGDYQAWNLSAEAYNVLGDVRLSWTTTNDIDSDVHLVVKGEAYNLKDETSIDVPNNSLDDMVLVVGDLSAYFGPEEFGLSKAYPNPFNPSTTLDLSLNESGLVTAQVYNVLGQVIATLADGHMNAGYHALTWDASSVSSGMYFVKVTAGADVAVQKLMLMK